MSATTDSGTAAPAALAERHAQCCSGGGRRARCLRAGRGSALGDRRHRTCERRSTSPIVATRMVCATGGDAKPRRQSARGRIQLWPIEQVSNHVGDDRIRFIWVASSLTLPTMLVSTPVTTSRNRAQAVFVEEPEPYVGNIFEFLADIELQQALRVGAITLALRRVVVISAARRTSRVPGGTRPPSTNLLISGRLRRRATMSSVTFSV